MGEDAGYGLVLSFSGIEFGDNAEHAFVHGVEFGQIYQRMTHSAEVEIRQSFHSANRILIERAAAAEGWDVTISPTDYDEWIDVHLRKVQASKPNPHGLRVVQ